MSYEYDIFISYRRDPEIRSWISDHFKPLINYYVGDELRRKPSIYIDEQLESGTAWPISLGEALGRSLTLRALWSGSYLSSGWCSAEFGHMLAREKFAKSRSDAQRWAIIIPIFILDGETFPKNLGYIQHFEIKECFSVRMAPKS